MKTASLLGLLVFASFACTTTPGKSDSDERREIVGLEEMSLEYIQGSWGDPDSSTPRGDGKTVRFKNIRAEDEDPISGRVDVKYCDVKLELNKDLIVTAWEYESCRPKK